MPRYAYDTDTYPTLAVLVTAHPRAVSSLVRVYRDGGGVRYLDKAEDEELHRLVNAGPVRLDSRDQAPAQVRVRVWNEEYQAIVGAAKAAGMNVRDWATMVLLREAAGSGAAQGAAQGAAIGATIGAAKASAPPAEPGKECPECGGRGNYIVPGGVKPCQACGGTGYIEIR